MRILAIHHDKGGVGKSSAAQNLGVAAARHGVKTLLVDADGQANLTESFGLDSRNLPGLVDAFRDEMAMSNKPLPIKSVRENLSILPGRYELFTVAREIESYDGRREGVLSKILKRVQVDFDLVIIDTPPGAGWLVFNALFAADHVIAPIQCENFAILGISDFAATLTDLSRKYDRDVRISRIVPTFVHGGRKEHSQFLEGLREQYGELVTQTVIRTDAQIPRSQTNDQSIFDFDPKARSAADYESLGQELQLWAH